MNNVCIVCGATPKRLSNRFCSNKCQQDHQYRVYIGQWKSGEVDGGRGVNTRNISQHIKRYLREKYGELCSECGWSERHSVTMRVPLEIDHIDGNAENNVETNLRLLCPNCHSLTPRFRNLNAGSGRKWRMNKYQKIN